MKSLPKYKACRRLGPGVYEKCQSEKFALSEVKRPGVRRSLSDYGAQLLEKQRVRTTYGVGERQFRKYVREAVGRSTAPTELLHRSLETRLDNVVYRLGLAPTRRAARQMVSHGHITVNARRITVPSYTVHVGDAIAIREGSAGKALFAGLDEGLQDFAAPSWISFDTKRRAATITALPQALGDEATHLSTIIEFYSR